MEQVLNIQEQLNNLKQSETDSLVRFVELLVKVDKRLQKNIKLKGKDVSKSNGARSKTRTK